MRNIIFFLLLTLVVKNLLAMDEKAIVPFEQNEQSEEVALLGKETVFQKLIKKIHEKEDEFDLQMGTVANTSLPLIIIDDNEFVILDGQINALSLDIDFKGMNLVFIGDLAINKEVNISCENLLSFGNITAGGDISIKATNNLFFFGSQINSNGKLDIVATSNIVMNGILNRDKAFLFSSIRRAIAYHDMYTLGRVMIKVLESASPKKLELQPIQ